MSARDQDGSKCNGSPRALARKAQLRGEYTCPRTPRALHPHFEAPRSPLDATTAQAAQAETPQRTQTARREDKTTSQQTTDLLNSPPVQRQASRLALLLTAPPAPPPAPKQWWNSRPPAQSVVEPLHPIPTQRTRDCPAKPGAAAEHKWTSKIRYPRKIPPFQHHDDPGCCPCAEGAAVALQKIAPAPHLMPLGKAPYSCAQYDLAGHTDGTDFEPTGVTFDLVPVAIAAVGNQRTTCFPQISHYTPAFVAAHRRKAIGNQRTTCFPQIAHYTPAFVAAHRRTAIGHQRATCFPQIAH